MRSDVRRLGAAAAGHGLLVVGLLVQPACTSKTEPHGEAVGQSVSALCSSTTLGASPTSPATIGATIQFTATPSCAGGDTPQWQLYVLKPGSLTWTLLQDWQPTSTQYNWDTTSAAEGGYLFQTVVRSSSGESSFDSYANLNYDLKTPVTCSSVTAFVSPSSAAAGQPLTLTASATCTTGATPDYRFWVQPAGGAWEIFQDYSSSSTATFVGNDSANQYRFEVDTHADGNGVGKLYDYDSWTEVDYKYASPGSCPGGDTVCNVSVCANTMTDSANCGGCAPLPSGGGGTGGSICAADSACTGGSCIAATCGTMTGSASPNPATVGQTVTLTGNATCSAGGAEYHFWVYPPGGPWTSVQAYSAANSYSWDTTGRSPGTYYIEIDARHAGSTGAPDAFESYQILSETLQAGADCPSVTASYSVPGAAGTPVTISASATCTSGATPEYRFWVMPTNGGYWAIFQDYSTSATASFVGNDALDSYRIEVDTRASGNGNPTYDSWKEVDFVYASPGACPGGDTVCDISVCANTSSNPAFCGSCSNACAIGQTCSSGACK